MNIDIFGSCITRDPFEFDDNHFTVKNYFSRTSLVSAIHKPFKIDKEIKLQNNFYNRVVRDDIEKTFKKYTANPESKIIIIDLIQERYPLNYHDKNLNTYSPDYRRAKLPIGKLIQFEKQFKLFEHYIKKISSLFEKYDLVIIHEAFLAENYINDSGHVESFNLKPADIYFNNYGNKYYDILRTHIPNTKTIKLTGYNGSANHKWGLSPSHYENQYYIDFNKQLEKIIESKKDEE